MKDILQYFDFSIFGQVEILHCTSVSHAKLSLDDDFGGGDLLSGDLLSGDLYKVGVAQTLIGYLSQIILSANVCNQDMPYLTSCLHCGVVSSGDLKHTHTHTKGICGEFHQQPYAPKSTSL